MIEQAFRERLAALIKTHDAPPNGAKAWDDAWWEMICECSEEQCERADDLRGLHIQNATIDDFEDPNG